ncbi:MAG TPA: fumarylacetoacetate hydrolase family protein [Opitutaceae bacterium]
MENLPFGILHPRPGGEARVGVAIGEQILDLAELAGAGLFSRALPETPGVFGRGSLNAYLALGRPAWRRVRAALQRLLSLDVPDLRDDVAVRARALVAQNGVDMLLPVEAGDFTDFYASREHATNVGSMFRPENPLLPNWVHLPVACHGRSSSIVVSGTPVRRPLGQVKPDDACTPSFGASRLLDLELELGAVVGLGNEFGAPVPAAAALDHVFGFVLLNDWSARDVQKWEYQPLGPFLEKNFATTISP